jgi:hypothetical protein
MRGATNKIRRKAAHKRKVGDVGGKATLAAGGSSGSCRTGLCVIVMSLAAFAASSVRMPAPLQTPATAPVTCIIWDVYSGVVVYMCMCAVAAAPLLRFCCLFVHA